MVSLPTGSNQLLYIETTKLCFSIKGDTAGALFPRAGANDISRLKIYCGDQTAACVKGCMITESTSGPRHGRIHEYVLPPLFYEQQRYELVIEADCDESVEFWHDNINIRNKISRAGRRQGLLTGVINFGSEVGYSDLVVRLHGIEYLRVTIEVFPTKIDYRGDYAAILSDVTAEVYNLVFDYLKKTYTTYNPSVGGRSSPVEFFAIIQRIFNDFLRGAELAAKQPHHLLEPTHEITRSTTHGRYDNLTIKWIQKHPESVRLTNDRLNFSQALLSRKRLSYNTKENQFIKYVLLDTIGRLESFKRNFLLLGRCDDGLIIERRIDKMIALLTGCTKSHFLSEVSALPSHPVMSLVLTMSAGYRELYKYYLMLQRGLSVTGELFKISVKDIALLYEYWCFIKMNAIMKERYDLLSQNVIKTQNNGLSVSLLKGRCSQVRYVDSKRGDTITLSYNPKETKLPTVTQRPDNVLVLEKVGANIKYEYVFDAKYRINPAVPGSDYASSVFPAPGPEVEDINAMHRYRDAIVCKNGASPFERIMFGAYVLFPYGDENEYSEHRFYKSIEKVNIGGLPFLPSATKLASKLIDELVAASPESALEHTTLPVGVEAKLAKIDWKVRDVMVGAMRNASQLKTCVDEKFYHVPVNRLKDIDFPVRYIAVYQSARIFRKDAGIRLYGEVTNYELVRRCEITEIPRASDELYYKFHVKEWKELSVPIAVKEKRIWAVYMTNLFLLLHSREVPELFIKSEAEYRLFKELKRITAEFSINEEETNNLTFKYSDALIFIDEGKINMIMDGRIVAQYAVESFINKPGSVLTGIRGKLCR